MKKFQSKINQSWQKFSHFFPTRLFLGHLKYHHLILLMWAIPFLIAFNVLGKEFGIPSLFLAPRYMQEVGIYSFFFMGLATGSFIMAYNIASYVLFAHRYPFIVTVSRPLYVYALNNSFIPVVYILSYLYQSAAFQSHFELIKTPEIILNLFFFLIGILLFIFFSLGFFFVIRTIYSVPPLKENKGTRWIKKVIDTQKKEKIEQAPKENKGPTRVSTYLNTSFRIINSREFSHYDEESLSRVFHQQHINLLLYILLMLIFIIVSGQFKDTPIMMLPAGASTQLLLTLILLFTALFYILFKNWTFLILLMIIVVGSYTQFLNIDRYNNNAYGMRYPQNNEKIPLLKDGNYTTDSLNTIKILNHWKRRVTNDTLPEHKPKIIIICPSGGGLKLATWTYYALAYADSATRGNLLSHTRLITGASGGMLGASYLRALYLEKIQGKIKYLFQPEYFKRISTDILNPVFFTFVTSDWFFRLQHFQYGGYTYFKDRAYMFDKTVNRNLGPLMNVPLAYYRQPEESAQIPMLILSPTIVNSGTELLISPTGVSYLTKPSYNRTLKNIEFRRAYKNFNADSLRFVSAIRMNATFPYLTPIVALPGTPTLSLMDAGINDDYGFLTAYAFIMEFRKWINKNTGGVIIIRLAQRNEIDYQTSKNYISRFFKPAGTLFSDWPNIQQNNYFMPLARLNQVLNGKMHIINFWFGTKKLKVTLNWHLTKQGKKILHDAIFSPENQQEVKRLQKLLTPTNVKTPQRD